ncbi:hypothetical protein BO99DRAFT_32634 [Aspergillus violaceofuscus CBS 115571]|uniref:Uncharacterized protein n=1 Tax=Aspergillus violaceofuscus (strain CBS 115571) TaxID=1450538 RepID=A0A2V5I0U4_ASPV1|nr:hypothetical protein BO99DRAFT_32634 [Aspergillus violaceofuscus CBS 115571]
MRDEKRENRFEITSASIRRPSTNHTVAYGIRLIFTSLYTHTPTQSVVDPAWLPLLTVLFSPRARPSYDSPISSCTYIRILLSDLLTRADVISHKTRCWLCFMLRLLEGPMCGFTGARWPICSFLSEFYALGTTNLSVCVRLMFSLWAEGRLVH